MWHHSVRIARRAVSAIALAHVVLYVAVALLRLGYPYEVEWVEGGVLDHVARVRCGEPLAALSIQPTFVDSAGETWDAVRMGVVNQAIAAWESHIGDAQTVDVTFDFTNAGSGSYLGQW